MRFVERSRWRLGGRVGFRSRVQELQREIEAIRPVAKQCGEQPTCLARNRVGASLLANCVFREQARSYIVNPVNREQARSYAPKEVLLELNIAHIFSCHLKELL